MSDPYGEIAKRFSIPAPDFNFRFGVIISASPLSVEVGGLTIESNSLWINEALLEIPRKADFEGEDVQIKDPSSTVNLPELYAGTANISMPAASVQGTDGLFTFKEPLKAGDRVLLLSDQDQVFYILCKVVSAS